jgi:hypothetical protein
MGFYDFYIIPLAKKLRDCGVFGPTSDENLNYAKSNRAQWEREGQGIVTKMLQTAEEEYNAQYMEESYNNMSPDSEFDNSEFHDEQIMVRFDHNRKEIRKTNLPSYSEYEEDLKGENAVRFDGISKKFIEIDLSKFDDEKKTEEQIRVRFKD